jgi:SAM-dependent methyltransferase
VAHKEQTNFCRYVKYTFPEYFINKKILDIGSLDINGNNRFLFENCEYVGLDVASGPNVDIVSVAHLYDAPNDTFDTIISTEVFEHDMYYIETIKNIIRMLKPGGAFIFTCASTGRLEHGTIKSDGSFAAPLLTQISEEWSNYYKNLTEDDFNDINEFKTNFPTGTCEYFSINEFNHDLYFFGVKHNTDIRFKLKPLSFYFRHFKKNILDFTPFLGPRIEITGNIGRTYKVLFIDSYKNEIIQSSYLSTNNWLQLPSRSVTNIKIVIESDDGEIYEFYYT